MKKALTTLFVSVMLVFVGVISVACGTPATKIDEFKVKGLTLNYENLDSVDLSGIELEVTYDNDDKKTLKNYEIDKEGELDEDTEFVIFTDGLSKEIDGKITVGEYEITAKVVGFMEQTLNLGTVIVSYAERTNVRYVNVNNLPKLYYTVDTVDLKSENITLEVTYNNYEKETLTKYEIGKTWAEVDDDVEFILDIGKLASQTPGELQEGKYPILAEIRGYSKIGIGSIEVKVATAEDIISQELIGLEKREYTNLEECDLSGLTLKITYGNQESVTLTKYEIDKAWEDVGEDVEFILNTDGLFNETSEKGGLAVGTHQLTAVIRDFEGEIDLGDIKVVYADRTSISSSQISNLPTNFYEEDTFALAENITFSVTYDNYETETLTKFEVDVDIEDVKADTQFVIYTDGLSSQTAGDLTVGTYDITVKVVGFSEELSVGTIEVKTNWELYDLQIFNSPTFVKTYNENKEISESEDSFYNADEKYTVGDDNAFKFQPTITLYRKGTPIGPDTILENPINFNVDVTVEVYENGEYVTADESLYTYFQFEFDFTESAIGKEFRITMEPSDYETLLGGGVAQPVSFEFKVEDGWNAYTPDDLGRINLIEEGFDNDGYARRLSQEIFWDSVNGYKNGKKRYVDIWTEYFEEKGYTDLTAVNAIFIQKDIAVQESDLPSEYLISEAEAGANTNAVGTLRDYAFLYTHYLNEDFVVNGNYFTLNFSEIRPCESNTGVDGFVYKPNTADYELGHATVFGFAGRTDNTSTGVATFKNINLIGNTGKAVSGGNEILKASGGLILLKSMHATTQVENAIAKQFLIAWYGEQAVSDAEINKDKGNINLDYTKTYDCFNSGVFGFISNNNTITNSELKRFGGPAILIISGEKKANDEEGGSGAAGGIIVGDFTVEDCVIENFVAGDEAWFMLNGAAGVSNTFATLDKAVFNLFNKTIFQQVKVEDKNGEGEKYQSKSNLIAISLNRGYLTPGDPVKTDFTINDNKFTTYDEIQTKAGDTINVGEIVSKGNIAITSSQNDYIEIDASYKPVKIPTTTGFAGDYMGLAMKYEGAGVGLVYQLYDLQTA